MPYVLHVRAAPDRALDVLIELGAIDVEDAGDAGITALIPDGVSPDRAARALGVADVSVTPAEGRDDGSVWTLRPRPVVIGPIRIVPADMPAGPGAVRLVDAPVFGTGLHPTTALCLELLIEIVRADAPRSMLDVGTGSGVLALAALTLGVPRATAIDIDGNAIRVAAENARINGVSDRMELRLGGPEESGAVYPLVVANVLAAPLVDLAPTIVRRVAHRGQLVLGGIHHSLDEDVVRAYRRLGMHHVSTRSRADWTAIVLQASW